MESPKQFLTKYICYFQKKSSIFEANKIKDMGKIYELSFIPKWQAYMKKDKTKRFWYLYVKNKEVGIISEFSKRYYIYDYNKLENIYAGNNMLELSTTIKNLYNLYNNVSHETKINK